ncbi:MAG: hypothetical protein FGM15_05520 [Chthoniobacterales bacterium]|nr:hypothetical protein [Chthoniobacterales bacterium]
MTAIRRAGILAAAFAGLAALPLHASNQPGIPDQLEMKDGRSLRGMILKNSADSVLFQTRDGEVVIPKSSIRRIREEADQDVYLAQVTGRGKLPSWQAIVHDFRDHDTVWRVELIPPVAVQSGEFKNIPYTSFLVNKQGRMNIYGDPDNPVAIEFGIYGKRGRSSRYHQIVREFLAGHLYSRKEIAALYSLSLAGDTHRAGNLAFKITPPTAPGANGGWWIAVYDPSRLASARVGEAEYAKVTRPFSEVNNADGTLRQLSSALWDNWLVAAVRQLPAHIPKIRGFYRDENGVFHVMRLDPQGT